ncbi:hypothetical protein [Prevotella jejuni]
MKSNELTTLELIATGAKCAYQKPSCEVLSLETESMICSSVTGETENEDVSGNQGDPWYTRQDD